MTQAIFVRETGGPEVLRLEPHDPGKPGPGLLRVRVKAAGVNYTDVYSRAGTNPAVLPYVAGLEGAGVVEEVGPGVEDVTVGSRVGWSGQPASYAEVALIAAAKAVPLPDGVIEEDAAAVLLQGMTAHYLVYGLRDVTLGSSALVHAAAGGVGLLLVQMLKELGVNVIGTCSTAEKEEIARAAGADDIIIYEDGVDFDAKVRELTEDKGVDIVYDAVGKSTFDASLRSLRPRGMLALYGHASGRVPNFDPVRLGEHGSIFLTRPSLNHYTLDRAELEMRANFVLSAVADGRLKLRIGGRYPLGDAAEAHRALESRGTTGKLLLIP
ncbi:MAG: zinc-binding dehydrogenase [Dehalococcoidia bacterium]|nr:zinc-binding dehydrogenase [Dehalococcoidia bacterium]